MEEEQESSTHGGEGENKYGDINLGLVFIALPLLQFISLTVPELFL